MNLGASTALITGGAVRIGRAISLALAREGCRVAIHYRNSRAEAVALAAEIRRAGGHAVTIAGRLDRPDRMAALFDRAVRAAGPIDLLINNAAAFHKHDWSAMTAARLCEELAVNLESPMLLMQAFARQGRPGAVVNLLDRRIAGVDPSCVPYEISKKGLAAATRSAAIAWAPRIRVNAVAPGVVLPPPGRGPAYLRDRAGWIPLGRSTPPADIAEAVIYLARAESVTGQILFVDGGQHLGASPEFARPPKPADS